MPSSVPPSSVIYAHSSEAVVAEIDGQMVALDITKGVCYGLNKVASRVWQLIETPGTADQVCERLMQEFDIDQATCLEQTSDLLHDLNTAGLVTSGGN